MLHTAATCDSCLVVERVPAEVTFPLRLRVLGRGVRPADLARADDQHPDTGHFASRRGDEVVATGTVRRRQPHFRKERDGWQIRGMAVEEGERGRGLGTAILGAIIEHVAKSGGGVLWCHVRVPAASLYRRAGFDTLGGTFVDPVAGQQILMWRMVASPEERTGATPQR